MGKRATHCGPGPWSLEMITQQVFPLALRPKEAAKSLGISPRHLFQLTADHQIPFIKVGSGKRKTVFYSVSALRNWLSAPSVGGVETADIPADLIKPQTKEPKGSV